MWLSNGVLIGLWVGLIADSWRIVFSTYVRCCSLCVVGALLVSGMSVLLLSVLVLVSCVSRCLRLLLLVGGAGFTYFDFLTYVMCAGCWSECCYYSSFFVVTLLLVVGCGRFLLVFCLGIC